MSSAIIILDSVDTAVKRDLSIEADSLPVLMHDWLSELLFLFGTEGLVFREYSVSVEKKDSSYVLNASMSGEQFSRKKHVILTDIKAVTYHSLKVEERAEGWIAEVLCDI
jgi:SHS2 domain-containing protein